MSPRRIQVWACAFKCGRIGTKRDVIAWHENTCMFNPARRACPTCQHDEHEDEALGGGPQIERIYYCAFETINEVETRGDKRMIFNCQHWEAKP